MYIHRISPVVVDCSCVYVCGCLLNILNLGIQHHRMIETIKLKISRNPRMHKAWNQRIHTTLMCFSLGDGTTSTEHV